MPLGNAPKLASALRAPKAPATPPSGGTFRRGHFNTINLTVTVFETVSECRRNQAPDSHCEEKNWTRDYRGKYAEAKQNSPKVFVEVFSTNLARQHADQTVRQEAEKRISSYPAPTQMRKHPFAEGPNTKMVDYFPFLECHTPISAKGFWESGQKSQNLSGEQTQLRITEKPGGYYASFP